MARMSMHLAALALVTLAGQAQARTFENCAKPDQKLADAAIGASLELALRAAAAVGETPEYQAWFGPYSTPRGETVRRTLKAVHRELAADEIKTVCLGPQDIDCKAGTYAYVMYDRPRVIHLCPSFFAMPSMADARAGIGDQENGTREGTIIHEMSHFPFTGNTGDECYSRSVCGNMAGDTGRAVTNADSYQYFCEDVMLLFWVTPG